MQRLDGVVAPQDLRRVGQRAQQGSAQHSLAHRRATAIECVEERGLRIAVAEQRVDQLQIPNRYLVQLQALRPLIKADAVDMVELRLLGVAGVVQHRSGGDGRGRMPGQAEPVERLRPQLSLEQRDRVVAGEGVGVDRGLRADSTQRLERLRGLGVGEERMRGGVEQFGRFDLGQLVDRLRNRLRPEELGGAKVSGR